MQRRDAQNCASMLRARGMMWKAGQGGPDPRFDRRRRDGPALSDHRERGGRRGAINDGDNLPSGGLTVNAATDNREPQVSLATFQSPQSAADLCRGGEQSACPINQGTLAATPNYAMSFVDGTLVVTAAPASAASASDFGVSPNRFVPRSRNFELSLPCLTACRRRCGDDIGALRQGCYRRNAVLDLHQFPTV